MQNPIYNKQHVREYLLYGVICALLYCLMVTLFLQANRYENFYYLYIGNALFMATIFYYAFRLLFRPYDRKRAVSMLIAGHFAALTGVVLSAIFIAIAWFFFFPHPEQPRAPGNVLANAAPGTKTSLPGDLLFMLMVNNFVCNSAIGSFISVVTSYAGKINQTRDEPADLHAVTKDDNT